MTLKTRRLLFYFLVFSFVVAAAAIIFYSVGFRIDFKNQLIVETGGIYIKSRPVDVDINLNGEVIKNDAGIFNSGTLMDNLGPGVHHLVLNIDGYSGWQKNIDVLPGVVSVFDSIVLISNNAREKIYEKVDEFRFINGLFITQSEGSIEFDGASIVGDKIVHFTENGNVVTQSNRNGNYYLSNIFDLGSSLNLSLMFNNLKETRLGLPGAVQIVKIAPYPFDDRRFVIMTGRAIYTLHTEDLEIEQIDPSAEDFIVSGNEVFWINDSGISSYNFLFGTKSLIDDGLIENIKLIDADSSGDKLMVLDGTGLLKYVDRDSATTTIISDNTTYFSLAPNDRLLTFVDRGGVVRVYDLEWEKGDKDERVIDLITMDTNVDEVAWYENSAYMFIKDNLSNLSFVEINDDSPINEVLISENVNSFVYDSGTKSLYFGNDSGLWQLEI